MGQEQSGVQSGRQGELPRCWRRGRDALQLKTWSVGPGHQGVNPSSGKNMFCRVLNYWGVGVVPLAAKDTGSGRRVFLYLSKVLRSLG